MFNRDRLVQLRDRYRHDLLHDTLPFWLPRCIDSEQGGYFTCFGRDGTLLQDDKAVWFQGRFAWLLATLHREVEARSEWLEAAQSGLSFIDRHAIDTDGRFFFWLTRDGRPLRKRRYVFSECFACLAMAADARARGDRTTAIRSLDLLQRIVTLTRTPGALPPKIDPATRPQKGLALPMILIVTAQEVRAATSDPWCTQLIDGCIEEIRRDFLKQDLGAVLESVAPDGSLLPGFDGRLINPGHAIEAGWFILEEARQRGGDAALTSLGCCIIDLSWERGWDPVHGGLLYFTDVQGMPPTEYWHDMKFWWPHNEAVIAMLLAYEQTGDPKYARWHTAVHDWAHAHFPDPVHGEWYGYLHRDGTVSTSLKGNMWKGPFHLPRMQLLGWQICERLLSRSTP